MCSRVIFRVSSLSVILFLVCCGGGGGGGGGSSSTPEDTSFMLFSDDAFIEGYHKSFLLAGSDNTGHNYTLSISNQVGSRTTFNGEQAIPVHQIIVLTDTGTNQFITISQTGYYSDSVSNRKLLGTINDTYNTISLASTASILPQVVEIGDLGTVGTYIADDGSSFDQTWRITDAGHGRANRIVSTTSKDMYGNITGSSEVTEVIDQDFNIYSVTYRMYFADSGLTVTLTGK